MPLVITEKEIKWHQSYDKVLITVPLSSRIGVKPSTFITSKYLKVSSSPYLWECFLNDSIDPRCSFARLTNECVSFELLKSVTEPWTCLLHTEATCESYRKKQREEAFEENRQYLENMLKSKNQKKYKVHKESIHKQMELDDLERKLVEKEKQLENEKAAAEILRKKQQLTGKMIAEKRQYLLQKSQQIPPTRKSGHITVNFTPREFPTAARESQEAEEREWLEKQAAANRSLNLDCSDLSLEERNPKWLENKAESMSRTGDFRSAVNAYNLAIRICPNLYSLYKGRAACHLNLHNLHKAIEDSSKALELLVPPVTSNAVARKEAYKIRGSSFQQMDLHVEGLMDFEAALKIDSNDEELKINAENLRSYIENATH